MKKVLITGANGQLGSCLQDVLKGNSGYKPTYTDRDELDITDKKSVEQFFSSGSYDYCINAAAYTQVDRAEEQKELAFAINAEGASNLAAACAQHNCTLIHISTDYVFSGKKQTPYTETDRTRPIGVYGASKLKGEQEIIRQCKQHYIIRTSWLYSRYGHNFYRTVLNLYGQGKTMTVTTEQTGAPTNANDLAAVLVRIMDNDTGRYGIYNFSNQGEATWFDFAYSILEAHPDFDEANLEKTDHYRTLAARPKYSVLDNSKLQQTFAVEPVSWKKSLYRLINNTL